MDFRGSNDMKKRELTGTLAQVYLTSFNEGKAKVKIDLRYEATPELNNICNEYVDGFLEDNYDSILENANEHLEGIPLFTIKATRDNMGIDTRYDVDKDKTQKFITYVYTFCINSDESDISKFVKNLIN